jgi:RNA polymerase sigma factor (sigma-70 family)
MLTASVFDMANGHLTQHLEEIFREHYALVYRTAYHVTGRPQDAEDVLQDVFLWFLQRGLPADLRDTKAYLYRAAVNASLKVAKARQREIASEDAQQPEPRTEIAEHQMTDRQGRLVDAITQLHPKSVEMLILRYGHDYSDAEIATLLGKSRGVVSVTLHRARTKLRKLLLLPREIRNETKCKG